jgi:hypothetical protein
VLECCRCWTNYSKGPIYSPSLKGGVEEGSGAPDALGEQPAITLARVSGPAETASIVLLGLRLGLRSFDLAPFLFLFLAGVDSSRPEHSVKRSRSACQPRSAPGQGSGWQSDEPVGALPWKGLPAACVRRYC